MVTAQAAPVRAGESLAKDLQSVLSGATKISGQVVEASENSAKRMAQANLSAFGQDMLALDGTLDDNSNYVDADKAVNKIYEQYKNVDVGSAQELLVEQEMFIAQEEQNRQPVNFLRLKKKS